MKMKRKWEVSVSDNKLTEAEKKFLDDEGFNNIVFYKRDIIDSMLITLDENIRDKSIDDVKQTLEDTLKLINEKSTMKQLNDFTEKHF